VLFRSLEDVFTYNDFSNTVLDPNHIPYMITEFNGHMFPTKTWDCEERKAEHAVRHARIQSMQMLDKRIAGAIGWCAFDYNTHASFGSGDRICYHGVSDMFRLPKWAAYVYASQVDPAKRIVLEVASRWTAGDRSGGGVEQLLVFSNCDSVKAYLGDDFQGEFYPAVKEYPGLQHPPYILKGLKIDWGSRGCGLRLEGYVSGKKAAEVLRSADPLPRSLKLWADSNELIADGQDMTALNFQIVDDTGHVVPFSSEIVSFSASGPVELIGTNPFVPQGGQGALYIKAGEKPGIAVIKAVTPRLGEYEVRVSVKAAE
jgi:beta-galactosidase